MHVQTLQMQLTYTASDTEEIKWVHFSKVRRKKMIIFVNKRKTEVILPFWSLHPPPPILSSNIERQLISAMLHKHSKFTNKSISSYKTRQTTKITIKPE